MKLIVSLLARQRVLMLALAHVIPAGMSFSAFCLWFGYDMELLIWHLLLTGSLYSMAAAVIMVGRRLGATGSASHAIAVWVLTAVSGFLLFVYIVNFLSNQAWKANMTFRLIGDVLSDLIRHQWYNALLIGLAVLLLFAALRYVYRFIWARLGAPDDAGRGWPGAVMVCLTISLYTAWDYRQIHGLFPDRPNPYGGEVITDMFFPYIDASQRQRPHSPALLQPVAAASLGAAASSTAARQNVIVIVADSLRADHMSAYGYERDTTPFLRGLVESGQAVAVQNAQSMCAQSHCSIIGLLTSRTYKNQQPGQNNLQAELRTAGYRVVFIASGDQFFSGRSVNHYPPYDMFTDGRSKPRDYATNDDRMVLSRLNDYPAATGQPHFFYIYLMASHVLGTRPAGTAVYLPQSIYVPATPLFFWNQIYAFFEDQLHGQLSEKTLHRMYHNFYDNGVHYADFIISRVFEILEKKGYLEDAQIWFLADHGEALGEKDQWGHQIGLGQNQLHIPMIIRDTRRRDYKERLFATQIDIPVTILSGLGRPVPADWEGVSLLDAPVNRVTSHRLPTYWDDFVNFLYLPGEQKIYKYIRAHREKPPVMYEITDDPGEVRNLIDAADGRQLIQEYHLHVDQAGQGNASVLKSE